MSCRMIQFNLRCIHSRRSRFGEPGLGIAINNMGFEETIRNNFGIQQKDGGKDDTLTSQIEIGDHLELVLVLV